MFPENRVTGLGLEGQPTSLNTKPLATRKENTEVKVCRRENGRGITSLSPRTARTLNGKEYVHLTAGGNCEHVAATVCVAVLFTVPFGAPVVQWCSAPCPGRSDQREQHLPLE